MIDCSARVVVRVALATAWALGVAAPPSSAQRSPSAGEAAAVTVAYREAADRFELLDQVSAWWPDYVDPAYRRAWAARGLERSGDSTAFAAYAQLRARHVDRTGQAGDDAAAWRADSTGSGLFSAGPALAADPVAAAFYASPTVEAALARLAGVLTRDEQAFLRGFYHRFASRVDPLLAETRGRTAPSLAVTAATLADPAVAAYLGQLAGLFAPGGEVAAAERVTRERAPAMEALYVWWPDSVQTRASPVGRTLLLRVRPAAGDTINSADVVVHEAVHVLAAGMRPTTQRALSAAVLAGCATAHGPPTGVRRLATLEEPIATALGNIEFRRRFQPRRFTWGRRWYGDAWVDVFARLLHPILVESLAAGWPLDAAFARNAGALCAALARLAPSSGG